MADVRVKSNIDSFMVKLKRDTGAALEAVGWQAVGMIKRNMQNGYHDIHPVNPKEWDKNPPHTAIRMTSSLMDDVHFEVNQSEKQVTVGNSLDYGLYVHQGTQRLKGRPYIKDAIQQGAPRLKEIFENYMKR